MVDIKKLTSDLLQRCIIEINNEENMDQLKTFVLNPLIGYVIGKIYPYLMVSVIVFLLTLLIAIAILILIIKK
jgi:hypothetical protein